jgi:hypothetical protein
LTYLLLGPLLEFFSKEFDPLLVDDITKVLLDIMVKIPVRPIKLVQPQLGSRPDLAQRPQSGPPANLEQPLFPSKIVSFSEMLEQGGGQQRGQVVPEVEQAAGPVVQELGGVAVDDLGAVGLAEQVVVVRVADRGQHELAAAAQHADRVHEPPEQEVDLVRVPEFAHGPEDRPGEGLLQPLAVLPVAFQTQGRVAQAVVALHHPEQLPDLLHCGRERTQVQVTALQVQR